MEGSERVCPRCGTPSTSSRWCAGCGLNLALQGDLPTAEAYAAKEREREWLAAQAVTDAGAGHDPVPAAPLQAAPPRPGLPLPRPTRRRRAWVAAAILIAAICGGALAAVLLTRGRHRPQLANSTTGRALRTSAATRPRPKATPSASAPSRSTTGTGTTPPGSQSRQQGGPPLQCGSLSTPDGGQVGNISTVSTTCRTARSLALAWAASHCPNATACVVKTYTCRSNATQGLMTKCTHGPVVVSFVSE